MCGRQTGRVCSAVHFVHRGGKMSFSQADDFALRFVKQEKNIYSRDNLVQQTASGGFDRKRIVKKREKKLYF